MGLNDLHFTKFELQEIFWNILYAFFDNDIIITQVWYIDRIWYVTKLLAMISKWMGAIFSTATGASFCQKWFAQN